MELGNLTKLILFIVARNKTKTRSFSSVTNSNLYRKAESWRSQSEEWKGMGLRVKD
jgi:hypothetical protein